MANRVLKDWTLSFKIDSLSCDAERFFTRLIMKADDFGYFHAHPHILISSLFPLKIQEGSITPSKVVVWLKECENSGLILLYRVNEKPYLKINDFGQRLRKMISRFPTENLADEGCAVKCPPEGILNPESETGILNPNPETKQELLPSSELKEFFIKVIDHLNQLADTKFKMSSAKTQGLIIARMNQGFTLEDFFHVNLVKCGEWKGDMKMEKYLRPETLYGNKFEGYLNQKINIDAGNSGNKSATIQDIFTQIVQRNRAT